MAKRKNSPSSTARNSAAVAAPTGELSIFGKIAWFSLLAMVFITPIIISNLTFLGLDLPITYDQFDIIKVFMQRVLGLIALAAWGWDMLVNGGRIRRTPVEWLILAFLAWVAISAVLSIHPATAFFGKYRRFEGLLSLVNYAVIYFLMLQYADRPSRIRRFAQTLFASGIVVAGYGVVQSLGLDPLKWGQLPFEVNRAFSTYGNPDLLAGFLMFSVFISLGLAIAEENLVWRGIYWFGFLLNMWCTVVAFARSAWVGGFVGIIIFVIIAIYQRAPWKTEDWVFSGATAAVAGSIIIRSLSNTNEVMNFGRRLQSIFEFGEGSAKTRFQIWSAAIDATKDRPLFGFGADTFRLVFPRYKPIEYVADAGYLSVADNVHNYPLQLMAGIGIPGMALLYGVFGWAAARSFPVIFKRGGGADRVVLAGIWTACAAYVVHLFFGLSVTGTSFLLWACMAVVLAPTAVSHDVKAPAWGIPMAAGLAVLALLGISYQFVFMQADNYYLKARIASRGGQRTEMAQKAVQLNPFNDMYRAEVGLAYTDETFAAVDAAQQGQQVTTAEVQDVFLKAEKALRETIAFVPWEYDNYVFLTNLYTLGGTVLNPSYYEQAIEVGRMGVRVEPYGPAVRFQLARALISAGQADEAVQHLAFARRMDPSYVDATILLADQFAAQDELDKAIRVLRLSESQRPGLPGVADKLAQFEASATAQPTTTTP
jgi:O-antigen ligase